MSVLTYRALVRQKLQKTGVWCINTPFIGQELASNI